MTKTIFLEGKAMLKKKCDTKNARNILLDLIRNNYKNGDKLPTEKQLTEELGVSRSVLREALRAIEESGLIVTRQGSGRYIRVPNVGEKIIDSYSIVIDTNPSVLFELLDVRIMLEMAALPKIIERANLDLLHELRALANKMVEKAEKGFSFDQEDRAFHLMLYSATGNTVLEQLLSAFWDMFENEKFDTRHENLFEVAYQHIELLDALSRQDLPAMTEITKKVLGDARYYITRYYESKRKMSDTYSQDHNKGQ